MPICGDRTYLIMKCFNQAEGHGECKIIEEHGTKWGYMISF